MISMIANKSQLYDLIWQDYFDKNKKNVEDSFIYDYIRQNKDKRANAVARSKESLDEYFSRKKPDKYIQIKAAYLAYESGLISREEYIQRFTLIASAKDKKTGQAKLPKCCSFDSDEALKASQEYIENKILKGCVSDFFQNAGYRQSAENSDEYYNKTAEKYVKEKEGYISDLDLWSAYYMYSSQGDTQSGEHYIPTIDSEYLGKCQKLLSSLDNEKYNEAIVPLYFDTVSGAGIFLIGGGRFDEDNKRNCRICLVNFNCCLENVTEMNETSFSMLVTEYDSIEDAFFNLKKEIADGSLCENYSYENDNRPYELDSCFEPFFRFSQREKQFDEKIIKIQKQKEELEYALYREKQNRRFVRR